MPSKNFSKIPSHCSPKKWSQPLKQNQLNEDFTPKSFQKPLQILSKHSETHNSRKSQKSEFKESLRQNHKEISQKSNSKNTDNIILKSEKNSVKQIINKKDDESKDENIQVPIITNTDNKKEALHATAATYQSNARTKLVARLLPPSMTEEDFLKAIEQKYISWVTWYRFIPGRLRDNNDRPSKNSICYLNFDLPQNADNFRKTYNGYSFVDSSHRIYRIIVCYSPYHKIPKAQENIDRRSNTILKDQLYLRFTESLNAIKKKNDNSFKKDDLNILTTDTGDNVTPLLLAFHLQQGVNTYVSGKSYFQKDYEKDFNINSEKYVSVNDETLSSEASFNIDNKKIITSESKTEIKKSRISDTGENFKNIKKINHRRKLR